MTGIFVRSKSLDFLFFAFLNIYVSISFMNYLIATCIQFDYQTDNKVNSNTREIQHLIMKLTW